MCFSAINGSGPAYLSELLHVYTLSCTLRSSSDSDTCMLKCKWRTHGFRIFPCFGPHIWNSLQQDLWHCSTLSSLIIVLTPNWNLPLLTVLLPQLITPPCFCYSLCVCVCLCMCCVCVCAVLGLCVCMCCVGCVCVCVCVHACVCMYRSVSCMFKLNGLNSLCLLFLLDIILYVNCISRTVLYMCIESCVLINMYHVNTQDIDARAIHVYYYYLCNIYAIGYPLDCTSWCHLPCSCFATLIYRLFPFDLTQCCACLCMFHSMLWCYSFQPTWCHRAP